MDFVLPRFVRITPLQRGCQPLKSSLFHSMTQVFINLLNKTTFVENFIKKLGCLLNSAPFIPEIVQYFRRSKPATDFLLFNSLLENK